jgi:hypothetical protein
MKLSNTHKNRSRSLIAGLAIVVALFGITALSRAMSTGNINVTVRNNSQRVISHLYLAPGDPNNWGPDQLNGSTIPSGGSYILSNVACGGSGVRVIAEDQNGCFVYYNASCDSNQVWEISDTATPDCGG